MSSSCDNESTKINNTDLVRNFVLSRNYNYSTNKDDIPRFVLQRLSEENGSKFKIGDRDDENDINLTDVIMDTSNYNNRLNFIIKNDSECLISYSHGGIGKHDVIDYFNHRSDLIHYRYNSFEIISDISDLDSLFLTKPIFIDCQINKE